MKLDLKSGPKLKLYINNYCYAYYISGLPGPLINYSQAFYSNSFVSRPSSQFSMLHAEKQEFMSLEWAWRRARGYFY